ncbi:MAG TPA: alpha/beta hydrolase [Marmoricola sp.]
MTSLTETFQTLLVRSLMALPDKAKRLLAGAPIEIEGQRLGTETQLMLRMEKLSHVTPAEQLPWGPARAALAMQSRVVGGQQPIGSVRDLTIDGPGGPIPLRLYTPTSRLGEHKVPTMLFIHGGGMVYGGDHSTHDLTCRAFAEESGVQLLSVDYRLAPEHPYPAGNEDCVAAYEWLVANADKVDADPARLAVGGDSAGGYFSAVVAITAAEKGLPLAFQLLIYPATDFVELSASRHRFGEGFFLTKQFMDQALDAFVPDHADRSGPMVSLVRRDSFPAGLAPAYVVTAGFDPLRDEGEAYAKLLAEHGVSVEAKRYPSMIHGFINMTGLGAEAPAYHREISEVLRTALR